MHSPRLRHRHLSLWSLEEAAIESLDSNPLSKELCSERSVKNGLQTPPSPPSQHDDSVPSSLRWWKHEIPQQPGKRDLLRDWQKSCEQEASTEVAEASCSSQESHSMADHKTQEPHEDVPDVGCWIRLHEQLRDLQSHSIADPRALEPDPKALEPRSKAMESDETITDTECWIRLHDQLSDLHRRVQDFAATRPTSDDTIAACSKQIPVAKREVCGQTHQEGSRYCSETLGPKLEGSLATNKLRQPLCHWGHWPTSSSPPTRLAVSPPPAGCTKGCVNRSLCLDSSTSTQGVCRKYPSSWEARRAYSVPRTPTRSLSPQRIAEPTTSPSQCKIEASRSLGNGTPNPTVHVPVYPL